MAAISANRQRLLVVSYEDFTSAPGLEFERICDYIGASYQRDALIEKEPNLNRFEPDPHLFGSIVAVTRDWREFLDFERVNNLENELKDVIDEFGYCRYT
jgi:hypothetical protein